VISFPNTIIAEIGPSFDAYLNQLSGRHRYRLRSKLRRSRSAIDLYATVVARPEDGVKSGRYSRTPIIVRNSDLNV
jgi:hypothetical protein